MDVAINYTIEAIAEITGGKIIQHNSQTQLTHLLLDSRKLLFPENTIFFSLQSSHLDSNDFIKILYEKEVRAFVIANKQFDIFHYPNATFILVENVLDALHLLAVHHREKFMTPLIGITGSNGKTIAKEWLYQLLDNDYNIVRSPKSYNSQIGVPLSVLQMHPEHSLAIIEACISEPGEMNKLEKIIQPEIGVLTNIGEAHSEGFENKSQKIYEKLTLFTHSSSLIYCIDNNDINEGVKVLQEKNTALNLFTWGKSSTALLQIVSIEKQNTLSIITAIHLQKKIEIRIPFTDDASIENAITCWCVLLHMKIAGEIIAERMLSLHPVEMRL